MECSPSSTSNGTLSSSSGSLPQSQLQLMTRHHDPSAVQVLSKDTNYSVSSQLPTSAVAHHQVMSPGLKHYSTSPSFVYPAPVLMNQPIIQPMWHWTFGRHCLTSEIIFISCVWILMCCASMYSSVTVACFFVLLSFINACNENYVIQRTSKLRVVYCSL